MARSKSADRRPPRRHLPTEEKRRIVELSLCKGASVRAIAKQYGVSRGSLNNWRARYRAGALDPHQPRPALLPVTIAPTPDRPRVRDCTVGMITVEVVFTSGVTVRIESGELNERFCCALLAQVQQ